jgi:wyosine [tRNA(Phe)-imidazoG37] synthetase (radical SAM superfamily)
MTSPLPSPEPEKSSVYGPVHSWRVGQSLGIDLLLDTSICSFNCIYCQLGDIQLKTSERKVYVPTERLKQDLYTSDWAKADIVTFSGSGEPTLALNLAEAIRTVKDITQKPVMILTNATLLRDPAVRHDLQEADIVACKLDAATEAGLKQMNRPVAGITLETIVEGIRLLKAEHPGKVALQCMFMPTNLQEVDALAALIERISPDEVQLNTPRRPYPLQWHLENRGNHRGPDDIEYPSRTLRVVQPLQAEEIELRLQQATNHRIPIVSIYRKEPLS